MSYCDYCGGDHAGGSSGCPQAVNVSPQQWQEYLGQAARIAALEAQMEEYQGQGEVTEELFAALRIDTGCPAGTSLRLHINGQLANLEARALAAEQELSGLDAMLMAVVRGADGCIPVEGYAKAGWNWAKRDLLEIINERDALRQRVEGLEGAIHTYLWGYEVEYTHGAADDFTLEVTGDGWDELSQMYEAHPVQHPSVLEAALAALPTGEPADKGESNATA